MMKLKKRNRAQRKKTVFNNEPENRNRAQSSETVLNHQI